MLFACLCDTSLHIVEEQVQALTGGIAAEQVVHIGQPAELVNEPGTNGLAELSERGIAKQKLMGFIGTQVAKVQPQEVSGKFAIRQQSLDLISAGDEHPTTTQIGEQFLQQMQQEGIAQRVIVVLHALQVIHHQEKGPCLIQRGNCSIDFRLSSQFWIRQNLLKKILRFLVFQKLA